MFESLHKSPLSAMLSAQKLAVHNWVDANAGDLSDWNQIIWNFGETAWREYRSAAWYVDLLTRQGFDVEAGSGGMPTAFAATWRNGAGPTIAGYAEYDGLPGNCQAASTVRKPRPGLSRFAGGHTDPHSALGVGALGGFLAAKTAMQQYGISGSLKFFGECAEKVRGSKPIHAAKGYYDDLDAAISFHPFYMLPLCNTVRWNTHCAAGFTVIYTFECTSPETWQTSAGDTPIPVAHATARAPGANDAVVTMYVTSKMTKESMLSSSSGWSMNETILTAGQATGDNLPAQMAQIIYTLRAPTVELADSVIRVLDNNAEHAAAAAHCAVKREWVSRSRPGLPNHALARLTYANLRTVGAPVFTGRAIEIAREIQANLGLEVMPAPYLEACERLIEPLEAERKLRRLLPEWQKNFTSDDYTEYCWHAPTVRLYIGRPTLKAPPGYRYPDWVMNALGGIRSCIDPMIRVAAQTIGSTVIDLLTDAAMLDEARTEFEQRTGGGIGGERWLAPLLPADFAAPVHYPWPEYITTKRGEEWCIPTAPEDL